MVTTGGDSGRGLEGIGSVSKKKEGEDLVNRVPAGKAPEFLEAARKRLAAMGVGLMLVGLEDAPADPVQNARDRFEQEANALLKSGKLKTRAECDALKNMGKAFINGDWPALATAVKGLGDNADKVLPLFKKLVEANANEKPDDPKQLQVTIVPDERGVKLAFEGEKVNGGKGKLLFSSQDNSLKFVTTTGKPLDIAKDDSDTAISDFKKYIQDQFAGRLPKADAPAEKPKEPEKELSDTAKACRKLLEEQLKELYPDKADLRKAYLAVFDAYAKKEGNDKILVDAQEKYDKTAKTDPKKAEIERIETLMGALNAWLISDGKIKRTDAPPVLTSKQSAYKEFPDPQAKILDENLKKIKRARELVQGEFDGTLDAKEKKELEGLRKEAKSLYEGDSTGVFGVKHYKIELVSGRKSKNISGKDVPVEVKDRYSELLVKGLDKLNADEKAELKACMLGMGTKPFYKDIYDAYKEGLKLKKDGKDIDLDELENKLKAYRAAREADAKAKDTDKDIAKIIADVKKMLGK